MKNIKIRFNTNYPDKSDKKWRLIVDGEEKLVDQIWINAPCVTTEDDMLVDNKIVTKYHISVLAQEVIIDEFASRNNWLIAQIK